MVSPKSKITVISAASLLAFSLGSAQLLAQPPEETAAWDEQLPVADIVVAGEFIDIATHIEFERAVLRVSGPQGYAATLRIPADTRAITADLLLDAEPAEMPASNNMTLEADQGWHTLPDGNYRYELDLISGDSLIGREIGEFQVTNGAASDHEPFSRNNRISSSLMRRIAGAVFDILIPSAQAQSNLFPSVIVLDDHNDDNRSWVSYNNNSESDNWRVGHRSGDFWWSKGGFGSAANNVMTLRTVSGGSLGINTTNPLNQLHIAAVTNNTAVRLENTVLTHLVRSSSVFGFEIREIEDNTTRIPFGIDAGAQTNSLRVTSNGNVGIGTDDVESFHKLTVDGNMAIGRWIDFTDQSGRNRLEIGPNGMSIRQDNTTQFLIARDAPLSSMLILNDRIFLNDNLRIGSGTIDPQAALHIRRSDGTAGVILEESQAIDINQQVTMRSNGNTGFLFENTRDDSTWQFRTGGPSGNSDSFLINRAGTGAPEFILQSNGNASFRGNVTANGILLTSSRETKTSISPLDPHEVLAKLDTLEVSQWRYTSEDEGAVHFGPMAEDFHEIFGLSDGRTLNMIDTNGVAFAAIQALSENNRELRERLAELESQIAGQQFSL